jgi:hypothetical protein
MALKKENGQLENGRLENAALYGILVHCGGDFGGMRSIHYRIEG